MKVAFVVPALEVDATWDPARRAPFIGIWAMASLLKESGHEAHYLDESVRNGGWEQRSLYQRTLIGTTATETSLDATWEEFQASKMRDFRSMNASEFTARYSAFQGKRIERTMCRIGLPEEETLERLAELQVEVVGIPLVASANYLPATRLGRLIKQRFPKMRLLFGGQHITAGPEKFLEANPWVDHISQGDAITTIQRMVEGRELLKIVPGNFQKMEEYPELDYSLIAEAGYPAIPTHTYPSGLRHVEWMSSRGCFRNCPFCFAGRLEQKVTQSGWERIEGQLNHFAAQGIQEIVFQDDAWLFQSKKRFPRLLGLMKERGLSFQNNGGVEFESFSTDIAELFAAYNRSGVGRCTSLYVPFNPRGWNADQATAGSMTRKYHHNLESLRIVRKEGVYVFTSLILGTPEQDKEAYEEDLLVVRGLIQDGYLDAALPLSATMLPGTEWHALNGHNIINPEDWPGFSLFTTHHRTDFMTPREIEERMVRTVKELGEIQTAGPWQTAFPA